MNLPQAISGYQVRALIEAQAAGLSEAEFSETLGRTTVTASLSDEGVNWPSGSLTWAQIKKIAKNDKKAYEIVDGELKQIRVYSDETGWVRVLCPTEAWPTVLVSGIPMHRIKNTNPEKDTQTKIRACGRLRGSVLDTATGLGYTAILAARTAERVVTLELDPAALELAKKSPWSVELFESEKIETLVGDAFELIDRFDAGSFDTVIHDPPTMSLGGELYSEEFYRKVGRVLSRKGTFFHYIGDPDSALGRRQYPGIMRRLKSAGFEKVERRPEAYGLVASSR